MVQGDQDGVGGSGRRLADVVADLTAIVDACRTESSPLGLFPVMYRAVTIEVGEELGDGFFSDPARVERLVVVFADRYIDAYRGHGAGDAISRSWSEAFRVSSSRRRLCILQHLLLGMNAHINLDLAVATAAVCPEADLPAFRGDFTRVNEVLFCLVDHLEEVLGEVSPWLRLVDRLGGGWDEAFFRRGIRRYRDEAWEAAEQLAALAPQDRADAVAALDTDACRLGRRIVRRASPSYPVALLVRARERRGVGAALDVLGDPVVNLRADVDLLAPPPGGDRH